MCTNKIGSACSVGHSLITQQRERFPHLHTFSDVKKSNSESKKKYVNIHKNVRVRAHTDTQWVERVRTKWVRNWWFLLYISKSVFPIIFFLPLFIIIIIIIWYSSFPFVGCCVFLFVVVAALVAVFHCSLFTISHNTHSTHNQNKNVFDRGHSLNARICVCVCGPFYFQFFFYLISVLLMFGWRTLFLLFDQKQRKMRAIVVCAQSEPNQNWENSPHNENVRFFLLSLACFIIKKKKVRRVCVVLLPSCSQLIIPTFSCLDSESLETCGLRLDEPISIRLLFL